ncbi:MAG: zinc-binding alcohol dehydrogenase family protein [Amnibacterium sp.]
MDMRAWAPADGGRVVLERRPIPEPGPGEVLVRVLACGVCRTDLHLLDRELPVHRPGTVPGHQVVGRVTAAGAGTSRFHAGDLVGIAWLRHTCGRCGWCRHGRENLCPDARFTGWDADGGFAEYATVPEAFAYRLPAGAEPVATAPLLCAGIIGFRALSRAALPPGGRLALFGFGSSAAITARIAQAAGSEVVVVTRGEENRRLAARMGFEVTAGEGVLPAAPVDSAILFAPAGGLVPLALDAVLPGGTVVVAGIHLSEIPALDYDRLLFRERDLRSVTANTRADGDAFLAVAGRLALRPVTTVHPFEGLPEALEALRRGAEAGSIVLAGAE